MSTYVIQKYNVSTKELTKPSMRAVAPSSLSFSVSTSVSSCIRSTTAMDISVKQHQDNSEISGI